MHQTRKGQQWYFGMKMHIGAGSRTGRAHSGGEIDEAARSIVVLVWPTLRCWRNDYFVTVAAA